MPRAPFDTSCDIYYGPGGLSPGAKYATANCRFVPDTIEGPLLYPLTDRVAYITMDSVVPNQPSVSGTDENVSYDYDASDIIAIPSGGTPVYQVLFVERLAYRTHTPYVRAHVRLFPPISTFVIGAGQCFNPSMTCSGSGIVSSTVVLAHGALIDPSMTCSGAGTVGNVCTGALIASGMACSGSGIIIATTSTGSLQNASMTISGAAIVGPTSSGSLTNQSMTLSASCSYAPSSSGVLTDATMTISGSGVYSLVATGSPSVDSSTCSGSGSYGPSASGSPSTSSMTCSGSGTVTAGLTVTSLSPNTGTHLGGTSVTITGTGFIIGTTLFEFTVGHAAVSVVVTSSTNATCVSPAGSVGVCNVVAHNGGTSSPTNAGNQYTYT
jgi:hypothetical protein